MSASLPYLKEEMTASSPLASYCTGSFEGVFRRLLFFACSLPNTPFAFAFKAAVLSPTIKSVPYR